jgi:hypothetical protein
MLMIPQEVTAWPTNNDGSKMLTDKEGTEKGAYLAVLCKMYDINENGNYTMHYPKTAVSCLLFFAAIIFLAAGISFLAGIAIVASLILFAFGLFLGFYHRSLIVDFSETGD